MYIHVQEPEEVWIGKINKIETVQDIQFSFNINDETSFYGR